MHETIIKAINNEQVNALPLYLDFTLQYLLKKKKKIFLRKTEKYSNNWDKNCKCL